MSSALSFELTPATEPQRLRPAPGESVPVVSDATGVIGASLLDDWNESDSDAVAAASIDDLDLPEPPRLTLRDIATESLMIDALLVRAEGELTPELETRLNQLAELLTRKTDGVVAYIEGLCADADVIVTEEKRLAVRRKALNSRAERFERFVKDQMIRMDRRSLAGEYSKLDVVFNPPKLTIYDEKLIPDRFIRRELVPETTVVTILDDAIKAALMAREKALAARAKVMANTIKKQQPAPLFSDTDLPDDVPGAALERGTRLRIG